MADINIDDLIHAGLPWSNPQKLTVKSDEYINQMVVNRGFLNLLSNDYYLDLKSERINQYIEGIIKNHIDDKDIHFTLDDFSSQEILSPINRGLTNNTTYILPLYEDADITYTYIKQIIQNSPKNLNGHTLIFAFSIPLSRIPAEQRSTKATNMIQSTLADKSTPKKDGIIYTLDLNNKNISFDSFYGGTIIILGNDQFYFNDLNLNGYVNYDLMFNPIINKDTRLLFEYIQNELIKTEIVQPLIYIKGTGLNNKLSVLSIRDCHADSFLYNLYIENNRNSDSQIENKQMPYAAQVASFYNMAIKENTINISPQFINDQTFNNLTINDLSLTSLGSLISNLTESNVFPMQIYYTNLNNNYLYFDGDLTEKTASNLIRKLIYGKYKDINDIKYDSASGCAIMFWMQNDFINKDIKEVPILYDYNGSDNIPQQNGFYLGLDRIAFYQKEKGNFPAAYIDIPFAQFKNSTDSNKWNLWYIQITKTALADPSANLHFKIKYISSGGLQVLFSLIDTTINYSLDNITINSDKNIKLFGYKNFLTGKNITFDHNIRNLMFFNNPLTDAEIMQIYSNGSITEYYNWEDQIIDKSMIENSAMYSSVYVYNTDMLNIINCYLVED